ncbi:MAG TPA: hypothetical protein DEP18_01005 [Flavobacteriales bacterium]|nr:hypothetical protein [Flavobacteriales bacterium]HRE74891.1 hypothetical protein [Flavobacteriales bacterium]HRJ37499.1 hypothetical protein [Flavobacteriales bacterium]
MPAKSNARIFKQNHPYHYWFEILLLFLGIALMSGILFEHRWFMTFDGPAHVGNARIMTALISGDPAGIGGYYKFTTFPQPNWTGHFVMMVFSFFLNGAAAEKATLFVILIAMVFSFRYLLRSFDNYNNAHSLLILPVCFGMFFYYGSYNFCFSVVFLLLSIGYLQRSISRLDPGRIFMIFILSGLTYFSHLSALPVLALISAGIIAFHALEAGKYAIVLSSKIYFRKQVLILIPHLPFIILVYIYQQKFGSDNYQYLSFSEILQFIIDGQYLIGFGFSELVYTRSITIMLYSVTLLTIISRIYQWKGAVKDIRLKDVFFIASVLVLLLVFILPDSDTKGGMVTTRLLTFHALFLAIWLCLGNTPSWARNLFPIAVLAITYFKATELSSQSKYQRELAGEIERAAQFIAPGDVVLPVNRGDNWLTVNHPMLLGADKPVVVLENYEVWHGYFPLSDANQSPLAAFPPRHREWFCNELAPALYSGKFVPDHIFIQESSHIFPCESDLNLFIEKNYVLKYSSQVCRLYSLRPNE